MDSTLKYDLKGEENEKLIEDKPTPQPNITMHRTRKPSHSRMLPVVMHRGFDP